MTAWIIEDEPPALRRLTKLLAEVRTQMNIAFSSDSIASCVRALKSKPHPDVIFSDIHLADGLSFSIWEQADCQAPIIFTTAYDQYGVRAFRVNSIDYLMKPINAPELDRALTKLHERAVPAPPQDWSRIAEIIQQRQPTYRERFLAQKGQEWLP
ncbi:MAG: response regulator, partial [Bacteroidota bacterium]